MKSITEVSIKDPGIDSIEAQQRKQYMVDLFVTQAKNYDFHDDVYGHAIKINLLRHLRAEKKFDGPEALSTQIRRDIEVAHEVLDAAQKELLLSCEENWSR